jgi:predicted ATP-dependent protease
LTCINAGGALAITLAGMKPLPAEALARRCDPADFSFETTAGLDTAPGAFGQERAEAALEFGIGVRRDGYNVFVMGPAGCGKRTLVKRVLGAHAARSPAAQDWVYVNNFAEPQRPIAIGLPAGRGSALRADTENLVEELRTVIPAVFDSDEYAHRVEGIDAEYKARHERALEQLGADAAKDHIALLRTPAGYSFAPLKDGEVISAEAFSALSDAERGRLTRTIEALQERLERIVRDVLRWRKERAERVRKLNRDMILIAVGQRVEELRQRYAEFPRLVEYFDAAEQDILANAEDFRRSEPSGPLVALGGKSVEQELRRYAVNLLVDRTSRDGSPVVFADHPTFPNLFGRVEHMHTLGTLVTDFTLVRAGAMHSANGGYLVVDALKLLVQPFAWEGLKRALVRGEVRIEPVTEFWGIASTVSLEPEPIPLAMKVVLLGERLYYYLLQAYDPDFARLFQVVADFEELHDRTPAGAQAAARMLALIAREEKLLPLEREAVARALDFAARRAGDARKLSADVAALTRLLCEADHLARGAGRAQVAGGDIEAAIEGQRARADRLKRRLHESILRGTVMVDTSGERVGQVNALSVIDLGEHPFAQPTRITATTRVGDGQVIDIQREVQLGGAIHSKGVMILAQFLAARYSGNRPHSLAASLAFEQTYGQVEGDSASMAELCALLSSLSGLPVRQSLAITGSINQLGEAQAIGGVNEKIEGFFEICSARGLTGSQGVIIPAANVEHLMLRQEVIDAVAAGRFHVYAVRSIDEAIELLTGVPAGALETTGDLARQTVNGRVATRLSELAALRRPPPAGRRQTWRRGGRAKNGRE